VGAANGIYAQMRRLFLSVRHTFVMYARELMKLTSGQQAEANAEPKPAGYFG
jgi:hypothetical protein